MTVGIFDGVHRGHKKILRHLIKSAARMKAESCVVTFHPHPSRVLYPRRTTPMLVSTQHKLRLLAGEGVDRIVLVKFTGDFAGIGHARFVEEVLVKRMNVKRLYVGRNFLFGKGRKGNPAALRRLGRRFGFSVEVVPPLKSGGKVISSTLIRRLITSGRLKEAERMLGRSVSILGTVTSGKKRGRILGFPTANLDLHHEAIPPSGVYIVKAKLLGRVYDGIMNIGFRPTFACDGLDSEPTAEVHIFGFKDDIYGEDLEIGFLKRLRAERRFAHRSSLRRRIAGDVKKAKEYFKKL